MDVCNESSVGYGQFKSILNSPTASTLCPMV